MPERYGKRSLILQQAGVKALGLAGQLHVGTSTFSEFVSDGSNAEAVAAQKGKSVLACYCQASKAINKLQVALEKEHGPLPTWTGGNAREFDPPERADDDANFQIIPRRPVRVVQHAPPLPDRSPLTLLMKLNLFFTQLSPMVRAVLIGTLVLMPNVIIAVSFALCRHFVTAAAAELGKAASESGNAFMEKVDSFGSSVHASVESELRGGHGNSQPPDGRGWMVAVVAFVFGRMIH